MADILTGVASLRDIGFLGGLVFILVGGYRKWWTWGWQLDEMRKDRDEWKTFAMNGTALAARAVTLVENKP